MPAAWQQILQAGDGPRSRSALLTAFGAFDLCGEPARIRRGGKSRERAFIAVDAGPPCDLDEELEHPRVLLLGEQIDLQVEMIATLRDARLPILGDQDEGDPQKAVIRSANRSLMDLSALAARSISKTDWTLRAVICSSLRRSWLAVSVDILDP